MIHVPMQAPCKCPDCLVAGVSERERPIKPDLHGRELARWLKGYDEFHAAIKAGLGPKDWAQAADRG